MCRAFKGTGIYYKKINLSKMLLVENNTPDLAYGTATHALTEMGALVNRDYLLRVAEPKNTQKIVLV